MEVFMVTFALARERPAPEAEYGPVPDPDSQPAAVPDTLLASAPDSERRSDPRAESAPGPDSPDPQAAPDPDSGSTPEPDPQDPQAASDQDALSLVLAALDDVPNPFDDAEALEELGDEIATLAAHLHAAEQRFLHLVAEFDLRRGWELGGHSSCAYWLSERTGLDLGTAREKVRTARKLAGLPRTSAAMARGELSFSQVRALTRVATETNEAELLELACGSTVHELERMVRGWKKGSARDEAERERAQYRSRTFSVFPDHEGMYVVKGKLMPEVAALLMRAIEAASDALWHEERAEGPAARRLRGEEERQAAAARRRADAVALLAERALWAGFGSRTTRCEADEREGERPGTHDGEESGSEAKRRKKQDTIRKLAEAPISGTRAERYQVILHVDAEALVDGDASGRSELEDGTRVSHEALRRLACDSSLVRMLRGRNDAVLDVGRKTRVISPALRRALEARDRGCRFPGCGRRFTDAHHLEHWALGGKTSLSNTLALCDFHHRLVHEGGWKVQWWGVGRPVFFDPRGGTHFDGRWKPPRDGPPPPPPEEPARALLEANRKLGVEPDALTAAARWKDERLIPDRVLFGALNALEDVPRR
jgi:hypothetical protein